MKSEFCNRKFEFQNTKSVTGIIYSNNKDILFITFIPSIYPANVEFASNTKPILAAITIFQWNRAPFRWIITNIRQNINPLRHNLLDSHMLLLFRRLHWEQMLLKR